MAKKDLIERLARGTDDAGRRGDLPPTRDRSDSVTTRVSKKVVRRRSRRRADPAEDAPEQAAASAPTADTPSEDRSARRVVRRRAPEASEPAAEAAPPAREETPLPPEVVAVMAAEAEERDETPAIPEVAAVVAADESAPAEAAAEAPAAEATPATEPAPAEAAAEAASTAEPEAPAKAAEPDAAPAPSEAPAPATPEPAAAAAATAADKAAPAAAETPASRRDRKPRFQGLGLGVVVPPPGYDPENPEAFRARQQREQAAAAATQRTESRFGRRSYVADTGASGSPGGDDRSRGRRRGRRTSAGNAGGTPGGLRPRRRAKRRAGPKTPSPQPKAQKRKIRVDGMISVAQLARELSVKAPIIIKKLMEYGTLVTVNEMLDIDTATLVANEFEYEVENVAFQEEAFLQHIDDGEDEGRATTRPPVVTIMGHVDHGKTTLLDTIRSARVAAGEAGGITQHIGAYQVDVDGQVITFLDTPGHAAFSAMRARGAEVTDLVILVVAADDGVQPQTVEAINHAKAADVPLIVAVNKCDKPGVNPETIRSRMGEHGLVPEEWGGDTMFVNVSALKGDGIDALLEAIVLQAEVLELVAIEDRHAEGVVIEAKVERGRGPVATVLVQQGTLKKNDHVVLGKAYGKVRAMMDFRGKQLKEAGPSTPVEIFGLSDLPGVGDAVQVVVNEKNARTLAEHREQQEKMALLSKNRRRTLEDLRRIAGEEEKKELLLVLKADVQGSLEALKAAILAIDVEGTDVRILHDGVGNITESDVNLVTANDGILVGFNVKPDARGRRAADEANVDLQLHTVIYSVLDLVEARMKGMLDPVFEERHQGSAEVRAIFNISRIGTIAGCLVLEGTVGRNHGARVFRDNEEIWKGEVNTLKRFKDDVREVSTGYECGIALQGFNDIQVGDVIQTFEMVQVDPS